MNYSKRSWYLCRWRLRARKVWNPWNSHCSRAALVLVFARQLPHRSDFEGAAKGQSRPYGVLLRQCTGGHIVACGKRVAPDPIGLDVQLRIVTHCVVLFLVASRITGLKDPHGCGGCLLISQKMWDDAFLDCCRGGRGGGCAAEQPGGPGW